MSYSTPEKNGNFYRTGKRIGLNGTSGVTALAIRPTYVHFVGNRTYYDGNYCNALTTKNDWCIDEQKSVDLWELEVWANASIAVTNFEVFAMKQKPIVSFAADNFDAIDTSADTVQLTGHAIETGDCLTYTRTGGTDIGLTSGSAYFARKVDADNISLHSGVEQAWANTDKINITGALSGTHTLDDNSANGVTNTRCRFFSLGLGGPAGDGAITLTEAKGWRDRLYHAPDVIGYAYSASFTGTIYLAAYPLLKVL